MSWVSTSERLEHLLAAYLRHNNHQGNRADICALATHIAACNDLKASLLCGVHIVGHKLSLHDLLLDRVSTLVDGQRVCELWFDYFG